MKDVKSCLDVEGRDSQIGPVSYQEARDRILPKLLMGYMSAAAVGNSKPGKNGRASAKARGGEVVPPCVVLARFGSSGLAIMRVYEIYPWLMFEIRIYLYQI